MYYKIRNPSFPNPRVVGFGEDLQVRQILNPDPYATNTSFPFFIGTFAIIFPLLLMAALFRFPVCLAVFAVPAADFTASLES